MTRTFLMIAFALALLFWAEADGDDAGENAYSGKFNWQKISVTNPPAARYAHGMVFDSDRKVTVLFGGWTGSAYLNDTCEWDGKNWEKKNVALSPSGRSLPAMAYDSFRKVTVLFGGLSGSPVNDTWEWDGSKWEQKKMQNSPPPLWGHKMAYDSSRKVVILFGGYCVQYGKEYEMKENARSNELWEYDGTDWRLIRPEITSSPRGISLHNMAYDANRRKTVIFGGESYEKESTVVSNAVFEWDGKNWDNPAVSAQRPGSRASFNMAYDSTRKQCVISGGYCSGKLNETFMWAWDGKNWAKINLSTVPLGQFHSDMVYDSNRDVIVLFGGDVNGAVNQTWEFKPLNGKK